MIYVLYIYHVPDIPDICIVHISYIILHTDNMIYVRDKFIDKHTMSYCLHAIFGSLRVQLHDPEARHFLLTVKLS